MKITSRQINELVKLPKTREVNTEYSEGKCFCIQDEEDEIITLSFELAKLNDSRPLLDNLHMERFFRESNGICSEEYNHSSTLKLLGSCTLGLK
jgi:hypothetical protein